MSFVLAGLALGDDPRSWADAGFTVTDDRLAIGPLTIVCRGDDAPATLLGHDDPLDIDGLAAEVLDEPAPPMPHPNGTTGLDHVVLATPDQERTQAAFAAVGLDCRRVRSVGSDDKPFEQRFYRLGACIAEVIGPPTGDRDDPLALWGLAFLTDDIDTTAGFYPADRIGRVKDAVQPGRRITTLRHEPFGISVPVAYMTPRA